MSVRNTIARIFKYKLLASGVQLRRFRNATFFGQDMLSLLEYLFLCMYIHIYLPKKDYVTHAFNDDIIETSKITTSKIKFYFYNLS
jgi:hypothetical protein